MRDPHVWKGNYYMNDMQFSELGLSQEILRAVEDMGFTVATEIQSAAIPLILAGRDVVGRSNTGTGKTAAFGIPAIERLDLSLRREVQVLILCPTRELAMQACEEIIKFAKYKPQVRPVAIYGGASIDRQISQLRSGANIIIGTPGRVMDHMRRRTLDLSHLKMLILDEADEMLNMGFREDIETILADVPEERQTILFSATMPPEILAITRQYQRDPEVIKVQNKQRTVETIAQYYYEVPIGHKTDALQLLLLLHEPKLSMIFCNTKKMVDELVEDLTHRGFKAAGIHGDMKQSARTQVMDRFKSAKTPILIATDVAARGIDVDDIDAVFNYDIPQDYEYYIHRIGRTGRAGKSGTAYTLTSGRKQAFAMRDIQAFVKAPITLKAIPGAAEIASKRLEKFTDKIKAVTESGKHEEYQAFVQELAEKDGVTAEDLAAALVYMTYGKEKRVIPDMRTAAPAPYADRAPRGFTPRGRSAHIVLSTGREHKAAANFILGAIVEESGIPGGQIGKIQIMDTQSIIEVPEGEKDHIIAAMDGAKINGRKVTARLASANELPVPSGYYGRGRDSGYQKRGSNRPRRTPGREGRYGG